MKNLLLLIITITLLSTSCTEVEETGFIGEWEGTIEILNSDGEAIQSETSAVISSKGGFSRECQVTARSLGLVFIAEENENFITYKNTEATNSSDTINQTYITGSTELIGDTLLKFDHEVIVMQGSSVISSEDFDFKMKRAE